MDVLWPLYIAIRIIMGVSAMLSNLLTLICVYKYTFLRSTANILVASLAMSDFLHGALTSGVLLFRDLPSTPWYASNILCLVGICFETTTIFAQYASFSMLALERRNSLLYQLHRSKKWDRTVLLRILCGMWAAIAICNISITVLYSDVPQGTSCNIKYYYPGFYMYIGAAIFVVTCITIATAYGHIAYIAYKSQNQVIPGPSACHENRQKDMKITRMMGMVVGIFFLVYIPFSISLLMLKTTSPTWQKSLHYISILLFDTNFWINPFIYAWRDKGFYRGFRRSLSCCPCWGQGADNSGVMANAPANQNASIMPMEPVAGSAATLPDTINSTNTARKLIPRSP